VFPSTNSHLQGSDGNIGFSKTVNKQTKPEIQITPTLIPQLKNITFLAAGGNHMLALDSHGAIYAWGCGQQSQLGRPVMESYRTIALTPSLVRIPRAKSKSKITAISAGQFHSFALTATGKVYTWGLNNFAQTGISPKPVSEDGEQDPS
jgi:regulator of chromosome condensation